MKVSVFVPEPDVYPTAVEDGEPVARASVGAPITFTTFENVTVTAITCPTLYVPFASAEVTLVIVGAVISIVKEGILRTEEMFPAASVTVIVQFEYVPAANALSVIVLLPEVAEVVADEQEPPYVIVPTSVVLNVNDGVVLFVGVGTGVTTASVGAVVSTTNVGTVNTDDAFPAASVTRIVQLEYVPCASALNVIVLLPDVADIVAEEHEPPYVIVPASVELNVNDGVVL